MANIKFSAFTNEAVDVTDTRLVGFKDGDTTANYMYDIDQIATGIFAADSGFTAGSVVFTGVGGVLSQDNTNFFWNDTNNRLGIGVNDPDSFLEVYGATTQQKWSFDEDSFTTMTVAADSDTTLATGEAGDFTLDVAGDLTLDVTGSATIDSDTGVITFSDSGATLATVESLRKESFIMACSDETTDLAVADGVATFQLPYDFTLLAGIEGVRASVNTAPVGSTITIDIEIGGSTILSTLLTIDVSEKTSYTALAPVIISDTTLTKNTEIKINIDQIGSGTAGKGLKVMFIGYQTP